MQQSVDSVYSRVIGTRPNSTLSLWEYQSAYLVSDYFYTLVLHVSTTTTTPLKLLILHTYA